MSWAKKQIPQKKAVSSCPTFHTRTLYVSVEVRDLFKVRAHGLPAYRSVDLQHHSPHGYFHPPRTSQLQGLTLFPIVAVGFGLFQLAVAS